MKDKIKKMMLSKEQIAKRTVELGKQITEDYQDKNLLVISLLKGSFVFTADLVRYIDLPTRIEFMTTSSYQNGCETSGKVQVLQDIQSDIQEYDVLIVDDITDSAITMSGVIELLSKRSPRSIKSCVLLDKPSRRKVDYSADYVGFEVPDMFIVGYGLNYGDYYRNVDHVFAFVDQAEDVSAEAVVDRYLDDIINYRNDLHEIPELAFEEHQTSAYIAAALDDMGISYEKVGTGIIAHIKGTGQHKKTYAFRADMDALPVTEHTNNPRPSKHPGKMHACGHDAHMSSVLGLAKILSSQTFEILDDIVLLFQPAEEGYAGAKTMVESEFLSRYGVDQIFGTHVQPMLQEGLYSTKPGEMMAMAGELDITIQATSAHGAMPELGVDGVVIAATLIQQLQTIVSRNISPLTPALVTIGKISGGERRNVIAREVNLEGTIRAYNQETFDTILQRINAMKKGLEEAYGVTITVEILSCYPAVVNDEEMVEEFFREMDHAVLQSPQMISEDFSFYQQQIPGMFVFVGVRNEEKGHVHSLHSDQFSFEPEALRYAPILFLKILQYKKSIK